VELGEVVELAKVREVVELVETLCSL